MPIGTTDFLIDIANQLARLEYEFAVVVREPYKDAPLVCLSNVKSADGGHVLQAGLNKMVEDKFGYGSDGHPI